MNYLHTILERSIVFLFVIAFGFVSLYTPQIFEPLTVEAGGLGPPPCPVPGAPCASESSTLGIVGNTGAVVPANIATSIQTLGSFTLDNVLDGVAWALAKNIVSEMTSSILNWVNSGFKGSPAFITDMEGFLLGIADRTFGEYLDELGGPFSFICAPFKLDVQVAVAIIYENQRANAGVSAPPTCTLTGALANLENFIDGVDTFTSGDGWEKWFAITANPSQYTPYGNVLEAQSQAQARLVNARGQELAVAGFGQGFLSSKVCEAIEGPSATKEKCTITTPGKTISAALDDSLSLGGKTLVEADEINEIISAVFTQLTQKAITGTMGLLGLSGGTGYTYSGTPFTEQVASASPTTNPDRLRSLLAESLAIEEDYRSLIQIYQPQLEAYATDIRKPADRTRAAAEAAREAAAANLVVAANIADLEALIIEFDAMNPVVPATLQTISEKYFGLPLHSESEVAGAETLWQALLR